MAFSSAETRKGRSHRRPATAAGTSRKFLSLVVALGAGTAVAIWFVATAATIQTMAPGSHDVAAAKPPIALVTARPKLSDPQQLIVGQQATTDALLDEAAIASYWKRKAGQTEESDDTLSVPTAIATASIGIGAGKPARPTWHELNAAKQAGRLDILKRAISASGTDAGRTTRLAFAPEESEGGLKVVASLGMPLPAPEAEIEIAFVGDALTPPASGPQVASLEETVDESEAETEIARLEDPFNHLLRPDINEVPLPSARPRVAVAQAPEPEATIPMRAKREPAAREAPKTLLAYARPENPLDSDDSPSIFGKRAQLPGRNSGIAVYDISAGVVHMPSGEKLKAHSGRGELRDDPRFVHVKNRGATPPNVYSLRMREARFHGVEAIRMTPVGGAKMYGRDGFLTHTYLLRRRGDSSGCVVFENYDRFLTAFKRGHVKTLVVVPKLAELPKYMAML